MKHNISLLLAALSLTLSCSDRMTGGEDSRTVQDISCSHLELTHHDAVEATATACGNIEYWECAQCGAVFSDSVSLKPYDGFIYTMPTNFIRNLSLLESNMGPQTKSMETAKLVSLVAGLVLDITSMSLSIDSYKKGIKKVEEAYKSLEEKVEKTTEDVNKMKAYLDTIQTNLKDASASIDAMNSKLSSMSTTLYQMQSGLEEIDRNLRSLISEIAYLEENLRVHSIMNNRQILLASLKLPSQDAFSIIKDYQDEAMDSLKVCHSWQDSSKVLSDYSDHQLNVIKSWAEYEGNHLSSAFKLLSTFTRVSYNPSETFPVVLKKYADAHIAWEHQGYEFRQDMLELDYLTMSLSANLAKMYYSMADDIDPVYGEVRAMQIDSLFKEACAEKTRDSLTMVEGYKLYRCCNATGRRYSVTPGYVDAGNLGAGQPGLPVSEDNSISRLDIESVEQFFYGTDTTEQNMFFSVGQGGMELKDNGLQKKLIIPYKTYTYPAAESGLCFFPLYYQQ